MNEYITQPYTKGKVKRGMFFWSPMGDSPLGNWSPQGYQFVAKISWVMLIPILSLPMCT